MTCIFTADIINSRKDASNQWLGDLKSLLSGFGKEPSDWEFYRGDAFQLEVKNPENALRTALQIKGLLRMRKLDVRISMGLGDKTIDAKTISESNGNAFVRSGELFEKLKPQKLVMAIDSGHAALNEELNLMFKFVSVLVSAWTPQSAEFVLQALDHPDLSQQDLGKKLGITQAAVSRRQKRAQFDLLMEAEAFFRKKIKQLDR